MYRTEGLSSLVDRYSLFLLDAWGVLHDGRTVFPEALDCLQRLAASGHMPIIVSNAARRRNAIEAELTATGLPRELYASVESSGEMTWHHLHERQGKRDPGATGYYLGPDRSKSICEQLEYRWVTDPGNAEFVLATGAPRGNPAHAKSLQPLVGQIVALGLPMICANPDLVAIRAGIPGISAGAIARLYSELGGQTLIQFGKPHRDIFDLAINNAGIGDRTRILMVGDGLPTDITGAANAGIDSLLITNGIHRDTLGGMNHQALISLENQYGASPTWVCESLRW